MGPLSEESGETRCGGKVSTSTWRFNGAALRRERRDVSFAIGIPNLPLASMGPLSEESGEPVPVPAPVPKAQLQWGRSPKRAESARKLIPERPVCHVLQCGAALRRERRELVDVAARELNRCGFNGAALRRERRVSSSSPKPAEAGLLQWGRSPKRAESLGTFLPSRRTSTCFNGAALRRERRVGCATCLPSKQPSSFNGAAVRRQRRDGAVGGRGELCGSFNGAALRRERRGARAGGAQPVEVRASMGPLSEESGESDLRRRAPAR